MLEIPVIAQSFEDGPYEEIESTKNGILVENDEDWEDAVYTLINNKEYRRDMGKKAKEYVLANYNIRDHAHKWKQAYKSIN
jgi:glycosyltransferase involved in cell wall biosynthesis